ncbi:uncharacterized protein V2V93DRAFT_373885 [Kockiozyma suomiensis]|uniref:uncharacterized protein n=1 Tax=Kockiozyma suomiensis TaxID=1337062 RepID=UPI003343F912
MDLVLRCNSLKCRAGLAQQAVVTTCGHIFCSGCANMLFGSNEPRVCAICETLLNGPEDVVATILNPTDGYRSSVLAGMSPAVISDIANRALSFWTYQCSLEIMFQKHNSQNLVDKNNRLKQYLEKLANDANTEISGLLDRMNVLRRDKENLEKKNNELSNALQDKNLQFGKLQGLYEHLKRKMLAGVFPAATPSRIQLNNEPPSARGGVTGRIVNPQRTPARRPLASIQNVMPTPSTWRRGRSSSGTGSPDDLAHRLHSTGIRSNSGF